ncbi:MAG: hypothetical protein GC179_18405 [Anaerolineaceae bacterium]|nr:hypothetical protein [Anaerolineaceae bacterium]
MSDQSTRRKRNQRDIHPPAMVLTERDKRIVEAVYQCRILRQDQIHTLFFGASKAASQRRLALLYHHGFLNRVFLTVRASYMLSPALYMLDRRGAELLRSDLGYDDITWSSKSQNVGQPFLEHTLAINDVRVAVTVACRTHGYALFDWRSEADLKGDYDRVIIQERNGGKQSVSLIPDSFFVVQTTKGKAPFFLEVDRGTETTGRFQDKIRAYQAYIQSGAYEKRYGYKSVRVLTVAFSQKRLENLKTVTEEVGGKERYWFALHTEIMPQNVFDEPMWWVSRDISQRVLF